MLSCYPQGLLSQSAEAGCLVQGHGWLSAELGEPCRFLQPGQHASP